MSYYNHCIICNKNAPNGDLCKYCFKTMKEYKNDYEYDEEYNGGMSYQEYRDEYFNLKNNAQYSKSKDKIFEICAQLYALSEILDDYFYDDYLLNRVINDIEYLTNFFEEDEYDDAFDFYDEFENDFSNQNESYNYTNKFKNFDNPVLYKCKDGHKVRSKSEKVIDDYLFEHNILHIYEKEIVIDQNITIHPDFYLPKFNLFIEHWGYNNIDYERKKQFKLDFYNKNKITVITTTEDDIQNLEAILDKKLKYFKKGIVN